MFPDLVQAGLVLTRRHRVADENADHALEIGESSTQQAELLLETAALAVLGGQEGADLAGHDGQGAAVVLDDLAEEEVLRLDRGGALVQGVDLRVADVLLDGIVLRVPGATE